MNTLNSPTSFSARRKGGLLLVALLGVPAMAFAAAAPDRTGQGGGRSRLHQLSRTRARDKAPRIGKYRRMVPPMPRKDCRR
jgi:hypothetical protein